MKLFKRKKAEPRLTIQFCPVLGVVDNHGFPVLSAPIIPWHAVTGNGSNKFDLTQGETHEQAKSCTAH